MLVLVSLCTAAAVFAGGGQAASGGAGKTHIRFAQWDGGLALETYNKVAEAYNKSQDKVEVEIINIPTDYDTKVMAMIAAGDPPECGFMEAATILFPLADEGVIVNLLDFFKTDSTVKYSDMWESVAYWQNKDTLLGIGTPEPFGVFYSPDLFRKYGVAEPPSRYETGWTWDEFVRTAQLLTIDKNGNNALSPRFDPDNIDVYGVTFGKWWAVYCAVYNVSGAEGFLYDNGTKWGFFSPEGIDAMQKLADLIYRYHVSPTPTASAGVPGTAEGFMTGKVAMEIAGQWVNDALMNDNVSYNVAPIPRIKTAGTTVTSAAFSILETPRKDAAWDFFKYMIKPESLRPLNVSGLWLPFTKLGLVQSNLDAIITPKHPRNQYDVFYVPVLDPNCKPVISAVVVDFAKINNEFSAVLDQLWSGEKNYQQIVNENQNRINALVKGYYEQGTF